MTYLTPSLNPRPKARSRSIWQILLAALLLLLVTPGVLFIAGLLSIRSHLEKTESFYPHVTFEQMQVVEQNTGIHFPKGSEALCYFYNSVDCIDPSMQAKIRIPSDVVQEFRTKELKSASSDLATVSGDFRPWWKSKHHIKIAEGEFNVESAFVQWALGTENGDHILYIHWMVV
ncbi:hypothetical protein [Prosthecobacter sp.]|uniref:hypothetical protein n=1 Tax=Prosthecobacter sp. TaxID=1965333 RepID=UPI003784F33A